MQAAVSDILNPIDVDAVSRSFLESSPTRHFAIDDFLRPDFLREVQAAYPSYREALRLGQRFSAVNESGKVQITDPSRFPEPVRLLGELLDSPDFVGLMSRITHIPDLLADDEHSGGGMHVMAPGGRLDVHVDFNIIRERCLYRRLNILVFVTPEWRREWGGLFELWDPKVRERFFSAAPMPNRCVAFNTSETSFHGVTPVSSPEGVDRTSYAAYYYTREASEDLEGRFHSTVFRARPDERWRGAVMMPVERAVRAAREAWRGAKRRLRGKPDDGRAADVRSEPGLEGR